MMVGRKPETDPSVRFMPRSSARLPTIQPPRPSTVNPADEGARRTRIHDRDQVRLPILTTSSNALPVDTLLGGIALQTTQTGKAKDTLVFGEILGRLGSRGEEEKGGDGEQEGRTAFDEEKDGPERNG